MRKKITILSFSSIVLVIGLVVLFSKSFKQTYAAYLTLADTVISLSRGSSWSSGVSGVYYTNSHEYRYVGANLENYVSFNNDIYRIIGVFDGNSHGMSGEYLVKLIRDRSLGDYSFGIADGDASNGSNNWTGSGAVARILLNEYFYNKTDTSTTYGDCENWTYYSNSDDYRTFDCSNIIGYGIDSSLQNYIQEVTWYLYGYSSTELSKQNWYLCERGQYSGCTSGNSGANDTSTTGKIGLMYVSDYLYASSYYSSSDTTAPSSEYYGTNNWLYSIYEWTIVPRSNHETREFFIASNTVRGALYNNLSYYSFAIRPTFYLKSSVYVTGGDGSFDNPYTIACDDCSS